MDDGPKPLDLKAGASSPRGGPDHLETERRRCRGLVPIMCPEDEIRLGSFSEKQGARQMDRFERLNHRRHWRARPRQDRRSLANQPIALSVVASA